MNRIEDLLRDAYRSTAQTVRPDSIRQLDEQSVTISLPAKRRARPAHRRLVIPLAAASAVALVGVLIAVIVPQVLTARTTAANGRSGAARHHPKAPSPAAASSAGQFLVAISGNKGQTLTVRNALSGVSVANIAAPKPGMSFSGLATGDGRTFVAVLWRASVCHSWLYQFRLNGAGQPGQLTPYAIPGSGQLLGPIAVSKDNKTFAYLGERCADPTGAAPSDLAVENVVTKRTRQWSLPKQADVSSLSLTADGSALAYNIGLTKLFASAAYVLPTNAPAGTAAQRSRVVATAAEFGASAEINSDVITPDGAWMYFTTNATGAAASSNRWQLRVADLRTGRTHIVGRYPGFPSYLTADPSVTQALVVAAPLSQPTPSTSPSSSPGATRSGSPVPASAPRGGQGQGQSQPASGLLLVNLATGTANFLKSPGWDPDSSIFIW